MTDIIRFLGHFIDFYDLEILITVAAYPIFVCLCWAIGRAIGLIDDRDSLE